MKFVFLSLTLFASAPALAQYTTHCAGPALAVATGDAKLAPLFLTIAWGEKIDPKSFYGKTIQAAMVTVNGEGPYAASFTHESYSTRCGQVSTTEGGVPGLVAVHFTTKDGSYCGGFHQEKTATLAVSPEGQSGVTYQLACSLEAGGAQ